ncbi:MAG: hypothetical protein EBT86_10425 [Actinobacteria bacterium]|nr:hypothetical protein [Actinomycetota bacterium]
MSNKPKVEVNLKFGTIKTNHLLDALAALLNDHEHKIFMMKNTNYVTYKNLYEEIHTALSKAQKGSGYSNRGVKRDFIDPERRQHLINRENFDENI